jgi:hypothetical protein
LRRPWLQQPPESARASHCLAHGRRPFGPRERGHGLRDLSRPHPQAAPSGPRHAESRPGVEANAPPVRTSTAAGEAAKPALQPGRLGQRGRSETSGRRRGWALRCHLERHSSSVSTRRQRGGSPANRRVSTCRQRGGSPADRAVSTSRQHGRSPANRRVSTCRQAERGTASARPATTSPVGGAHETSARSRRPVSRSNIRI